MFGEKLVVTEEIEALTSSKYIKVLNHKYINSNFCFQEDLITFVDARTYKSRCDEQFRFEVRLCFTLLFWTDNSVKVKKKEVLTKQIMFEPWMEDQDS